jgi:murein tripeptide amidase MpaA
MKQTAVEWLEKIRQGQKGQPFDDHEWEIAFNHAKEIEKEQIIDSYRDGRSDQQSERPSRFYNRMAEQYYNETFKS